ncbi:MAG TPA: glycosyltransferase family 39 protein [Alphaproteobacteria bacterium]
MTDSSPAPTPASLAEPHAGLYGLAGTLAVLAALTLLRVLYLYVYPFDLHPDEAQYWVWAQDLAFGYYSKPPMVAWLIAATTAVCGDGEAAVRIGAPLLHFLTALAVYGVGHRLFDRRVGFWAALLYATLPGVSFSSVVMSTDLPLLLFWAVGLYAYVRALQEKAWRWWLLLGLAIGLGLLGKYAMIFFPLSAGVHLALSRGRPNGWQWPKALAALLLGVAIYAPNVIWNADNSFVSYAHTSDNANLGSGHLFRLDSFFEFFGSQFGVFGPALFAALIVILLRRRGWLADARQRLLVAFVLPTLLIMLIEGFLSRANANWAAPAYVAGAVLVAAWALQANPRLWTGRALVASGSVVGHAGLIAVFLVFIAATFGRPDALPGKADPFKRVRGWHELGVAIDHVRNEYMPDATLLVDERKLMAETLYYVHPHPVQAYKWAPGPRIHDHFDLTRPYGTTAPDHVLYVTERTDASEIISRFAQADLIAEVRTPIGVGRERVVQLYDLEGFKGYR